MNECTVKDLVIQAEKHKVEPRHLKEMDNFFSTYEPLDEAALKERFQGIVGRIPNMPSKQTLKQMWDKFLRTERFDYVVSNNTVSMDQIVRIGFDKFVLTNGWTRVADLKKWRLNKVRIGVCPHCDNQFIPLIFQTNFGLCRICRPQFSAKAIRKYIDYVGSSDERYAGQEQDLLMNFFIMFYCDRSFRSLFTVGHPFAKGWEEFEFELSSSMKEAKERMATRMMAPIDIEVEELSND